MQRKPAWRKSSYSGGANTDCVEIAIAGARVAVRDSKDPGNTVLAFPADRWRGFLDGRRDRT